jgi:hypothetical protein
MSLPRLGDSAILSSPLSVLGRIFASRHDPLSHSNPIFLDRHHHLFLHSTMAAARVLSQESSAMAHTGGPRNLVDRSSD